jgi:hypothetical protein
VRVHVADQSGGAAKSWPQPAFQPALRAFKEAARKPPKGGCGQDWPPHNWAAGALSIASLHSGSFCLAKVGAEFLFQMVAERADKAAVILTTNLPSSEWTQVHSRGKGEADDGCSALRPSGTDRALWTRSVASNMPANTTTRCFWCCTVHCVGAAWRSVAPAASCMLAKESTALERNSRKHPRHLRNRTNSLRHRRRHYCNGRQRAATAP